MLIRNTFSASINIDNGLLRYVFEHTFNLQYLFYDLKVWRNLVFIKINLSNNNEIPTPTYLEKSLFRHTLLTREYNMTIQLNILNALKNYF